MRASNRAIEVGLGNDAAPSLRRLRMGVATSGSAKEWPAPQPQHEGGASSEEDHSWTAVSSPRSAGSEGSFEEVAVAPPTPLAVARLYPLQVRVLRE